MCSWSDTHDYHGNGLQAKMFEINSIIASNDDSSKYFLFFRQFFDNLSSQDL